VLRLKNHQKSFEVLVSGVFSTHFHSAYKVCLIKSRRAPTSFDQNTTGVVLRARINYKAPFPHLFRGDAAARDSHQRSRRCADDFFNFSLLREYTLSMAHMLCAIIVFYPLSVYALLMPLRERLGNVARARLRLIAC
jgi:hypothetical protein